MISRRQQRQKMFLLFGGLCTLALCFFNKALYLGSHGNLQGRIQHWYPYLYPEQCFLQHTPSLTPICLFLKSRRFSIPQNEAFDDRLINGKTVAQSNPTGSVYLRVYRLNLLIANEIRITRASAAVQVLVQKDRCHIVFIMQNALFWQMKRDLGSAWTILGDTVGP